MPTLRQVSIHALMKRATSRFIVYIIPCLCVSIHALMKRATVILRRRTTKTMVSIHALVKRATYQKMSHYSTTVISIHALVKRATLFSGLITVCFGISIHALVKRATSRSRNGCFPLCNFNPRPREEGDRRCVKVADKVRVFQSTPS